MTCLRRIMGTALLWAMPQRAKEARINRALRRMTRSFSNPRLVRYGDSGYQTLRSQGDSWISRV